MPTTHSTLRSRRVMAISFALLLSCATSANAAIQKTSSDDWSSTIFSTYGITILLVVVLIVLIVLKRARSSMKTRESEQRQSKPRNQPEKSYLTPAATPVNEPHRFHDRRTHEVEGVQVWEKPEAEQSVYGAYRVDQEVAKLVAGKPHRMDVMASRARDDRRAIEASLIKVLESSETTDEGRQRARLALEEYGFVARQSATMLMGRDAWERSSAARTLGQIGAQSSLTFLIEALHDGDSVVRNQAIASLGSLKMPAAIGALLDIARRHSDIPASLLSETLSECSVESLGFLDAPSADPGLLSSGTPIDEAPDSARSLSFQSLPEGSEDDDWADALARLKSSDEKTRSVAAQQLAFYPVQRSVAALTSLVANDPDSSVRSAAVASLGSIDHESVMVPVLIALADDSRIVRAAAARTLTGLQFDRATAYVRMMETADDALLRKVAQACIKTGIAEQATDRLASEDRRQAYEAFSLFSLLARAGEFDEIVDMIQNHRDEEVRLCAIRVLSVAGQPSMVPKLREIVGQEGMSETVRTAVLELLYKLDQDEPRINLTASDNEAATLHNSP